MVYEVQWHCQAKCYLTQYEFSCRLVNNLSEITYFKF
jgi:hypothetical protein